MSEETNVKLKGPNIFKRTYRKIRKNKKNIILFILIVLVILLGNIAALNLKSKNNLKEEKNTNTSLPDTFKTNVTNEDGTLINGAIGSLSIPSIELENAPIKDGVDMETLNMAIGHFQNSNYLDGNVALCSHNRGYTKNYFANLKNIKQDDLIIYKTKYEERKYKVQSISQINETDVKVTYPSDENKITLITCVENVPDKRICVVGTLIE